MTPAVACPERGDLGPVRGPRREQDRDRGDRRARHVRRPEPRDDQQLPDYARTVVFGRRGALADANDHVSLAEGTVQPTPWFQHHARRLVAETAHADGWGDPITWLHDVHSYFETRGDSRLASSCRSMLGKLGSALPRQRRSDERVPPRLRALGVSGREADVLELLAEHSFDPQHRRGRSISSPKAVRRTHREPGREARGDRRSRPSSPSQPRSALDPTD